jgi:hypothetical protein
MLINIFKVRSVGGNIKVLYSYLGNNIPRYTPLEGGTYTGGEYLCCIDNEINGIEELCEKKLFKYNNMSYLNVTPDKYNNKYRIIINYFSKTDPFILAKVNDI